MKLPGVEGNATIFYQNKKEEDPDFVGNGVKYTLMSVTGAMG